MQFTWHQLKIELIKQAWILIIKRSGLWSDGIWPDPIPHVLSVLRLRVFNILILSNHGVILGIHLHVLSHMVCSTPVLMIVCCQLYCNCPTLYLKWMCPSLFFFINVLTWITSLKTYFALSCQIVLKESSHFTYRWYFTKWNLILLSGSFSFISNLFRER